jgi:hypothetical protein
MSNNMSLDLRRLTVLDENKDIILLGDDAGNLFVAHREHPELKVMKAMSNHRHLVLPAFRPVKYEEVFNPAVSMDKTHTDEVDLHRLGYNDIFNRQTYAWLVGWSSKLKTWVMSLDAYNRHLESWE